MKLVGFLLIFNIFINVIFGGSFKYTNVKCKNLDTNFSDIAACKLKVIRRGVIALNVLVKLFKTPVTSVSINLSLWKKANGYKPFLYNQSLDFCNFMQHRKRYPFTNIVYATFINNSNINHTCPYDHDLIVNNCVLSEDMLTLIPLPTGDYMIQILVGAYNIWRAELKVYYTRVDSKDF